MDDDFEVRLTALADEIRAVSVPEESKPTVDRCIGQLPALYAEFRRTWESRQLDEICRLVRTAMEMMSGDRKAGSDAQQSVARMADGFRDLHEAFGLPGLNLKFASTQPPLKKGKAPK